MHSSAVLLQLSVYKWSYYSELIIVIKKYPQEKSDKTAGYAEMKTILM